MNRHRRQKAQRLGDDALSQSSFQAAHEGATEIGVAVIVERG